MKEFSDRINLHNYIQDSKCRDLAGLPSEPPEGTCERCNKALTWVHSGTCLGIIPHCRPCSLQRAEESLQRAKEYFARRGSKE